MSQISFDFGEDEVASTEGIPVLAACSGQKAIAFCPLLLMP
ncbi:MAG TPA: hypothetical protein V6C90_02550 [Coleofasciculaceae cyanobacterium]